MRRAVGRLSIVSPPRPAVVFSRPDLAAVGSAAEPRRVVDLPREEPSIFVSEARLNQFIKAEVSLYAEMEPQPLSIREVLDLSTPAQAARLAHQELPIRFAQRIEQIENLPGWDTSVELAEVHQFYLESFRELRLVELHGTRYDPVSDYDLRQFTGVIRNMKQRMRGVVPRLATSVRALKCAQGLSEQDVNNWLDMFLISRIGTEMLSAQFLACANAAGVAKRRRGIIEEECNPVRICSQAAQKAAKLCRQHFGLVEDPRIVIESSDFFVFPYVPQYLYYIMVELLKNSTRATVEATKDLSQLSQKPIIITVGADPDHVAIRLTDEGGGIPFNVADRVWSYMYSTARDPTSDGFAQQGTPLAGFGVGLPLSRLYARYLGGSLHLQSMPSVGTNAYLYLKRVECQARETV